MHLWGGYALGWAHRGDPTEIERREAMLELTRQGWALDNPAFRQMFTSLYMPEATPGAGRLVSTRCSASPPRPKTPRRCSGCSRRSTSATCSAKVTIPTLVGHSTRDAVVPFTAGRALAARIPGARFIAVESPNHLLLESDPGWPKYARIVRDFLT